MKLNTGEIVIKIEGISLEETERCRKIIHKLFELGFFNIKHGSFTAHFHEGKLSASDRNIKWREDKPTPDIGHLEQFAVVMNPVNNSTVARRTE